MGGSITRVCVCVCVVVVVVVVVVWDAIYWPKVCRGRWLLLVLGEVVVIVGCEVCVCWLASFHCIVYSGRLVLVFPTGCTIRTGEKRQTNRVSVFRSPMCEVHHVG